MLEIISLHIMSYYVLYLSGLFFIVFSSLALFFDFTLPNELRGFLFFAQVRSSSVYDHRSVWCITIGDWLGL